MPLHFLGHRARWAVVAVLALVVGIFIFDWLYPEQAILPVSAQKRLVPIYKVDTERQAVAISFDASWGAEYTLDILNTLDAYGIKSTFFLVNIWLQDYPDLAKEIVARGHEIGLHSESHPHFTSLSGEQMKEEVTSNAEMVRQVTGYDSKLFRPPFGDYDNRVMRTVEDLGYQVIQWSVDSLDWRNLSADEITARVLKKIGPGDIVLFHNNGLHTAEALPGILTQLKEKGLEVIPISELIYSGDCYTDQDGVQHRK